MIQALDYERLKVDVPEGVRGGWRIERFVIPDGPDPIAELHKRDGRPCLPGTYTQLNHRACGVMMSDTQSEMREHSEFLWHVEMPSVRRVLINGLGIGMCLKWALEQPHVEHVDVVELEEDVAFLAGPHYHAMVRRLGKSLTIWIGDAFNVQWPGDTCWDVAWHDIWPTICAGNLPEMKLLKRKYGSRVAWQGCWCERECGEYLRGRRVPIKQWEPWGGKKITSEFLEQL